MAGTRRIEPRLPADDPGSSRAPASGRDALSDPHVSGAAETGRSDAERASARPSGTGRPVGEGDGSQGLAGARGSGGAAERGVAQPPLRERDASSEGAGDGRG